LINKLAIRQADIGKMSEEIKMDEIDINIANYLISDKESFYVHLTHDSGYALPAFESRRISLDYLEGVTQGRFSCLKYPNFFPVHLLKPLILKKKENFTKFAQIDSS